VVSQTVYRIKIFCQNGYHLETVQNITVINDDILKVRNQVGYPWPNLVWLDLIL